MLYLAQYTVSFEDVETAMAKRLEWDTAKPDGFQLICEYTIHGQPPPFGGFMVFETDSVEDLNFLILFFGSTVTFDIRPCSDVLVAMEMTRKALGE